MTTESLPGNNLCISNDEMLKIVGKQMFTKNKKYLNHLVWHLDLTIVHSRFFFSSKSKSNQIAIVIYLLNVPF